MQERINSIEKKILSLQKKKQEIKQKQLLELAKLLEKCGLEDFDEETLAGALLSIPKANDHKKEEWREAGKKFLPEKRTGKSKKSAKVVSEKSAESGK